MCVNGVLDLMTLPFGQILVLPSLLLPLTTPLFMEISTNIKFNKNFARSCRKHYFTSSSQSSEHLPRVSSFPSGPRRPCMTVVISSFREDDELECLYKSEQESGGQGKVHVRIDQRKIPGYIRG